MNDEKPRDRVFLGDKEILPDTDKDFKDELVLRDRRGFYEEHEMKAKHGEMTRFGDKEVTMEHRGKPWERPSMIGENEIIYDKHDHTKVVSIGGEKVTDVRGREGDLFYDNKNGRFTTERPE